MQNQFCWKVNVPCYNCYEETNSKFHYFHDLNSSESQKMKLSNFSSMNYTNNKIFHSLSHYSNKHFSRIYFTISQISTFQGSYELTTFTITQRVIYYNHHWISISIIFSLAGTTTSSFIIIHS
jgi:hypothetical protein